METVNTPVLTLRATLAAPVTLAIAWMITNVTAQVSTYSCDLNHPLTTYFHTQTLTSVVETHLRVMWMLTALTSRATSLVLVTLASQGMDWRTVLVGWYSKTCLGSYMYRFIHPHILPPPLF